MNKTINNMHQIIQQTDEEKLAMYLKLSKRELALMLIEANKQLEWIIKPHQINPIYFGPSDWPFPQVPFVGTNPYELTGGDPNIRVWYGINHPVTGELISPTYQS